MARMFKDCLECGTRFYRGRNVWMLDWGQRQFCSKGCASKNKYGDDSTRFWSYVQRGGPRECWLWSGAFSRYGWARFRGRQDGAHRVAYILTRGEIPPGMELDHLCLNKRCVNPSHLEAVTSGENTRRWLANRSPKPDPVRCSIGHPMNESVCYRNTRGRLVCRICRAARKKAWRLKQKQECAS